MSQRQKISLDPSGVDLSLYPGTQKRTSSITGTPALGLDTSRISQVSYTSNASRASINSRDSSSSGTVVLGGISYPVGSVVGTSGLFVIGDPAGESSRPSSRHSDHSYQTETSARSSAGLLPEKGYGFESWNWLWIHYTVTLLAFACAVSFLGAAIGLIIQENMKCKLSLEWWQGTTVYHIKVPEYHTTDAGGTLGDFKGISERLPYLRHMGVGAVCLHHYLPMFYPNWDLPINFINVDTRLGSTLDLEDMIKDLHGRDIKVLLEWSPSRTHTDHYWYKESEADSAQHGTIYSDVYLWRDTPLNNTRPSPFYEWGQWTENTKRNQYFFNLNNTNAPVVNWSSPGTRKLGMDAMQWWLDRGVDGFFVRDFNDLYVETRSDRTAVIHEWRELLDRHSDRTGEYKILMTSGEYMDDIQRNYYAALKSIMACVDLIEVIFKPEDGAMAQTFPKAVQAGLKWQFGIPQSYSSGLPHAWSVANHQHPWISWRIRRLGGLSKQNLLSAIIAMFSLPGSISIYAGQEVARDPTLRSSHASGFNMFHWQSDGGMYRPALTDNDAPGFSFDESNLIAKISNRHFDAPSLRTNEGSLETESLEYLPCEPPSSCVFFRRSYKLQDYYYFIVNFGREGLELKLINYGLSVPVTVDTGNMNRKRINLKKVVLETHRTIVFSVAN